MNGWRGKKDGWMMDGKMDEWREKWMGRWMKGKMMDGWRERKMDGWVDGYSYLRTRYKSINKAAHFTRQTKQSTQLFPSASKGFEVHQSATLWEIVTS